MKTQQFIRKVSGKAVLCPRCWKRVTFRAKKIVHPYYTVELTCTSCKKTFRSRVR